MILSYTNIRNKEKITIILLLDIITLTHQVPSPLFAHRQNKIRKIGSAMNSTPKWPLLEGVWGDREVKSLTLLSHPCNHTASL